MTGFTAPELMPLKVDALAEDLAATTKTVHDALAAEQASVASIADALELADRALTLCARVFISGGFVDPRTMADAIGATTAALKKVRGGS